MEFKSEDSERNITKCRQICCAQLNQFKSVTTRLSLCVPWQRPPSIWYCPYFKWLEMSAAFNFMLYFKTLLPRQQNSFRPPDILNRSTNAFMFSLSALWKSSNHPPLWRWPCQHALQWGSHRALRRCEESSGCSAASPACRGSPSGWCWKWLGHCWHHLLAELLNERWPIDPLRVSINSIMYT